MTPPIAESAIHLASPGRDMAHAVEELLADLGVRNAFGVTGKPIAPFVHALEDSERIKWVMSRTEAGAVMESTGAWRVTGHVGLVVTTLGAGLLGTRAGLEIARSEGAHLVVVSPTLPAEQRGRHEPQDTDISADFRVAGAVFDLVAAIESVEELQALAARLSAGFSGAGGFLAHILVSSNLLGAEAPTVVLPRRRPARLVPDRSTMDEVVERIAGRRILVVAGRGARAHAGALRRLGVLIGALVVTTPGAKGAVDERSPLSLGVCGIGGQPEVLARVRACRPEVIVVLGSRLGAASVPPELLSLATTGVIHVDRDAHAMGWAEAASTLAVQSDIGEFLSALPARAEQLPHQPVAPWPNLVPVAAPVGPAPAGCVRPRALMHAIQQAIVDGSDAVVEADVGTAWAWVTSCLAFADPDRFHLETAVGSMGFAAAGAVGAAIALRRKVVAITGDWSFDFILPELRTAIDTDAPVVWIVLQNTGGQMVLDGDRAIHGRTTSSAVFRGGDLAGAVFAFGAGSRCVRSEEDLLPAIVEAMSAEGPFLVEVWVDTTDMPPYADRFTASRPDRPAAPAPAPARATADDPGAPGAQVLLGRFPAFAAVADRRPVQLANALAAMGGIGVAVETLARTALTEGSIPAAARELAILRVAFRLQDPYIWGGHALIAEEVGLELDADPGEPRPPGDAALVLAVDQLLDAGRVDTATRARLAPTWDDAALAELAVVVGTYRLVALITAGHGLTAEPGCPPLPAVWPGPVPE